MLEKHDEILRHYPFITFGSKNSLQYSSLSLSDLSFFTEKEKEYEHYLNYYCSETDEENKTIKSTESDKSNKILEHKCKKDIEDEELLNECYDNFPCNNSKKASGLNRLFGWN